MRDRAIRLATYGVAGLILLVIVSLVFLMGLDVASRRECQALGFEHGRFQLYDWPDPEPIFGAVCQYQLDVPLREVRPHIAE